MNFISFCRSPCMVESAPKALVVYIIDDDASVRDSLALMLGLVGYSTRSFADAETFLRTFDESWRGCVVADLRLPGMTGTELQKRVRQAGGEIPFVIVTAHGDVPAAREAFLAQAVDFIEKPFDESQLRAAIETAFGLEEKRASVAERDRVAKAKLARLTSREREVLELAARGLHAKEIATALGISFRTVELHKTRVMDKLEVRNIGELVRFALTGPDEKG